MKIWTLFLLSLFFAQPVSAVENSGFTSLIEAVKKESTSPYAVESLIIKGGDVNAVDEQGRTVLMLAAMHHPSELIPYLLIQGGADVNAKTPDTGKTALFFAVQYNSNPEIVSALLNYGADQNITDVFGRTAYDYAERNPKLKDSEVLWLFDKHHDKDEAPSSVSETSR